MDDGVGAVSACVRVPAKINLFLAVRGRRADGYHELATVLQTVDLHDEVRATLTGTPWSMQHPAERRAMRLSLRHDAGDGVPAGDDNLVLRAGRALLEELRADLDESADDLARTPRTELHLTKRIPVAAGMAGGSADAAAALLVLARLWETGLTVEELHPVAARLGSDVPFCLAGGTALATGTGTDTARVLSRGGAHWVVGASDEGLSTPAVYRAFDELDRGPSLVEPDLVLQAVRSGDVDLLASGMHNDLQDAALALRPELGDRLEAMRSAGALQAMVSGSGPTLLALAPDAEGARRIADRVGGEFSRVCVVSSPAGGPRLVDRALRSA